MINRRNFTWALAGCGLAGAGGSPRAGCQTNAWRINPANFGEVLAVLDRIKGYEYQGFETGYRNVQDRFGRAADTRRELDKRGLDFLGCHIFLLQYDPWTLLPPADLVEMVSAGASALGARRLILSGGSAGAERVLLERKAKALNAYGKLCKSRGLQLAYHNHDKEFRNGDEMERMLRLTDGELVHLMMDAGHAYLGRADIPSFFSRYHARIDGIHLRDFVKGEQVPLGEGEVDLQPLAAAIQAKKWTGWLINEEERLNDGRPGDAAVGPARRHVKKVFGV
ncbi:MAG: sugar phosphate isomerase/epimerase [Acidobacteria bacterium]|nr:sugar phosphate isomerase/epimerase [Acidobacteriota bacterium]